MRLLPRIVTVMLIALRAAAGDALEDTVRGGLLGAAAGALVSEFSDDDDPGRTIPFFAGLGALTGYAVHHHSRRDWGPRRHHPYGAAYGLPYLALPYAWYASRHPGGRWRVIPAPPPAGGVRKTPDPVPPADRHPGVRLIPVPVSLPNGAVVPITILRLGDRYIGPRGEAYPSMPDADTLRLRYGGGDGEGR